VRRDGYVAILVLALAVALGATGCGRDAGVAVSSTVVTTEGDVAAHDPSMVQAGGRFLVFSTHKGVETRESTDQQHWTLLGSAFPQGVPWVALYSGDPKEIWAPDVSYHGGQYWMYFAASSFGSNTSAIGLATSPTGLPGSWTDRGRVVESAPEDAYNAIDPNLLVDGSGRWWLSFGSFWSGVQLIELDPTTGKRLSGSELTNIASRPDQKDGAIEAPALVRHAGYYYLFASFDYCCRGVDSTYRIMVGRSAEVTGPYLDREGHPMTSGGGSPVLTTSGNRIGPGGQSVYSGPGGDILVFHWYDGSQGGAVHLGLAPVRWMGGWPVAES
jgi:arabinan endo-1,5-alpha-L-arabinosidase